MSDIHYGMGQYRYDNNTTYLTEIENISTEYITINTDVYRDLIIKLPSSTTFTIGHSYLLRLQLPQNKIYNISAYLKLMEYTNETLQKYKYQYIKQILIPRETSVKTSEIMFYKVANNVYSGIIRQNSNDCKVFDVYKNGNDYQYKSDGENNPFITIPETDYIITNLAHAFDAGTSNKYVTYDIIFTPKNVENLTPNVIVIEINRQNSNEEDIVYMVDDTTYRGLYIDKDSSLFSIKILDMTELLGNSNFINQNSLSHIGIWGHPDLGMSINGEEIHIGQSGFYELNDYDIKSLKIAAANSDDKFIIDYQYKINI